MNKKLTRSQARRIKRATKTPAKLLAERHGISINTVYAIKAGRIWRSLP